MRLTPMTDVMPEQTVDLEALGEDCETVASEYRAAPAGTSIRSGTPAACSGERRRPRAARPRGVSGPSRRAAARGRVQDADQDRRSAVPSALGNVAPKARAPRGRG